MVKIVIPGEVKRIAKKLEEAGFQTYLVGGCVRDVLCGREPKDWDIATNARPEEIQKIFPASVYENQFGTVGIKTDTNDETLKVIEITTFRLEGKYTDKRHPDEIKFANVIEEDLARRDFTINSIALKIQGDRLQSTIVDPFGGQEDLKKKLIRTVGNPEERFGEDALRLIRAVRFAVQLDFKIEKETAEAIKSEASLLEMIAKARIRDELEKINMAPRASEGI